MLANIIGITLSTSAFLYTVFHVMRDLKRIERERRRDRIVKRIMEGSANIAAEWRG